MPCLVKEDLRRCCRGLGPSGQNVKLGARRYDFFAAAMIRGVADEKDSIRGRFGY